MVRDEEWLVTQLEPADDGTFVHVQGLTELVRDTEAIFSTALDKIEPLDPAQAEVVGDDSPGYRRSRLWLESTLRKTSVPLADPALTVATQGLADPLDYQLSAVRKALDPDKLRPRILLADAVGLGKTLEIGMILTELVRRGRGERILVVTPKHVLEQMQFELWTRFALPFVRLDSVGIQRIRQKLPANRNPFAFYKRIIVSIDTLKSDRYLAHLEKQHWDAVVIDESHNVTNSSAQNNRLARLLATRSDALILASATPHNGKAESFAELVRMLEPSAVTPEGRARRGPGQAPGDPPPPAQPRGRERGRSRLGRTAGAGEPPRGGLPDRERDRRRARHRVAVPRGRQARRTRAPTPGSSPGRSPRPSCPHPRPSLRPSRTAFARWAIRPPTTADEIDALARLGEMAEQRSRRRVVQVRRARRAPTRHRRRTHARRCAPSSSPNVFPRCTGCRSGSPRTSAVRGRSRRACTAS